LTSDLEEEAEGVALDTLTAELYFDEEPDADDFEKLKALNLVEMLQNEVDAENWDMGRVRVVFRALKIAKPKEAIAFIQTRFDDLIIFAKDLCLLMEALDEDSPDCFNDLLDAVVEAILAPPASSVQLIRTWLLEIFVRGIICISLSRLKKLESLSTVVDKRQLLLIRGRCGDKNYFRKQKTATDHFSNFELSALLWGASCLPKDEYEKWLNTMKRALNRPLGSLYLKWLARNRTRLVSKLKSRMLDQHD
jgi:hypothetical protein